MRKKNVFTNKIFYNVGDATDGLSKDERLSFLKEAHELFNGKILKKIYDALVSGQVLYAAREAKSLEQLALARGSINGLDIMYKAIEDYSNEYQDLLKNGGEEMSREESLKLI